MLRSFIFLTLLLAFFSVSCQNADDAEEDRLVLRVLNHQTALPGTITIIFELSTESGEKISDLEDSSLSIQSNGAALNKSAYTMEKRVLNQYRIIYTAADMPASQTLKLMVKHLGKSAVQEITAVLPGMELYIDEQSVPDINTMNAVITVTDTETRPMADLTNDNFKIFANDVLIENTDLYSFVKSSDQSLSGTYSMEYFDESLAGEVTITIQVNYGTSSVERDLVYNLGYEQEISLFVNNYDNNDELESGGEYLIPEIVDGTIPQVDFAITNVGTRDLAISEFTVVGGDTTFFEVVSPTKLDLQGGRSTYFSVIFDPSEYGEKSIQISITSNDESENTFLLNVKSIVAQKTVSLTSPAINEAIIDTKPSLSWEKTWSNPYLPSVTFHMQLSDTSDFTNILEDQTNIEGTSVALQTVLTQLAQYYWRVAVLDVNGVEANFGEPHTFTVNVIGPALSTPSGDITNTKPVLSWSSPYENEIFLIQVARDVDFTNMVEQTLQEDAYSNTSYIVENALSNNGTYYWRVAVVDANGVVGEFSATKTFTVKLGTVDLLSPSNDTYTNDSLPTFSWKKNDNAVSYLLVISTNSNLSSPILTKYGITDTGYTLSVAEELILTAMTRFYWAVTPIDANGVGGTRSTIYTFLEFVANYQPFLTSIDRSIVWVYDLDTSIQLTYQIRNSQRDANLATTIKFYWSEDIVITNKDILLGTDTTAIIPGNTITSDLLAPLAIPTLRPPGTYSIGYILDAESKLTETDETDNITNENLIASITLILNQEKDYIKWHIPDTNQTTDYTGTVGEDHDYTFNAMSYTDNANGTTTDNVTGLMWERDLTTGFIPINWNDANASCYNKSFAGFDDWRLPTRSEMQSIVNYGKTTAPPFNLDTVVSNFFMPNTSTGSQKYWTATSLASDSTKAWYLNAISGYPTGSPPIMDGNGGFNVELKSQNLWVRCVRN